MKKSCTQLKWLREQQIDFLNCYIAVASFTILSVCVCLCVWEGGKPHLFSRLTPLALFQLRRFKDSCVISPYFPASYSFRTSPSLSSPASHTPLVPISPRLLPETTLSFPTGVCPLKTCSLKHHSEAVHKILYK